MTDSDPSEAATVRNTRRIEAMRETLGTRSGSAAGTHETAALEADLAFLTRWNQRIDTPARKVAMTLESVGLAAGPDELREVGNRSYRTLSDGETRAVEAAIDPVYYRSQRQSVGEDAPLSRTDSLLHYLERGAAMGLSPHPLFHPGWYLRHAKLDRRDPELPDFVHYVLEGEARGYWPHPLFDPAYYSRVNPRVADSGLPAHVHYTDHGWKERRAPNAFFDDRFYASEAADQVYSRAPLFDYCERGELLGWRPNPAFQPHHYAYPTGFRAGNGAALAHYIHVGRAMGQSANAIEAEHADTARTTILCVAHSASERLFGAERSFLDVLGSIDRSRFRVVVALPSPHRSAYDYFEPFAEAVHITPRVYWEKGVGINDRAVLQFRDIITRERAALVYVNTIVTREPVLAAQMEGVPCVLHVREAIAADEDLQDVIGESASDIIRQVKSGADTLICNSNYLRDMFEAPDAPVIPNAVSLGEAEPGPDYDAERPLRLGMLSSNLKKKGIGDAVELLRAATAEGLDVELHLFGPITEEARELQDANGDLEGLHLRGYASDAMSALDDIDVVLVLSHFAESFGRTIIEAAARSRPAIVYDHGAPPEVVEDGQTGHVIPYREPLAALPILRQWATHPDSVARMGEAARKRAEDRYGMDALSRSINALFDAEAVEPPEPETAGPAPVSVILPNYNYADYLPERIRSILNQTRPPAEIIVLDDASPDNSLEVIDRELADTDIPYTILPSKQNLGPYKQWLRGLAKATQPWVWIAEADDRCEPDFLERLLEHAEPDVNLIYAQSRRIDGEGRMTQAHNRGHTDALDTDRWKRDFTTLGRREFIDFVARRNTIPNASAVLMRRSAIGGIEDQLADMQFIGDWMLYAHVLQHGRMAYVASSLNHFRRHERSVTKSRGQDMAYLHELMTVREFIAERYPLTRSDVDAMDRFLDMDYAIDDVEQNSATPIVTDTRDRIDPTLAARKRIAIITTNNGSHNGGSEMLWQETAERLSADGHDVLALIKLWTPRPELFDRLEGQGVSLLYKEEKGFERLLSRRPDLVIVSIGDQDEGIEYYSALAKAGIPYVIVNQLTKEPAVWPIRKQKTPAVKKGYLGAHTAFFTSKNNHAVMEKRLRTKIPNAAIHFNPYHIDRSHVPDWPAGETTHIAIPSKLLFIHKGQDILTEFLGSRTWQTRDIVFNFYGAGPDAENLEALAAKNGIGNFVLHGRVDDIGDIWRDNHALLMPSRMEGLPIMLVSAMLSARPGILTDIGGHAEVVTEGVSGFIAPEPNARDVEAALERAWARRAEWEVMGQAARQAILDFLPEDPVQDFVVKLDAILAEVADR